MKKLIMLRHGQSLWNMENRFTGWTDIDLSEKGVEEAIEAGRVIKKYNLDIDLCFTSYLTRAIRTLYLALYEADLLYLPVFKTYRLNERHYGALQGLNKKEMADKFGDEQVRLWRRSYATLPPQLEEDDPRYPGFDKRYKYLSKDELTKGESLKVTLERVLPYYENAIKPAFNSNDTILISAHGNSLRALAKHIENISDEDIPNLEIPTGLLIVYEFDDNLNFIRKYELR